MARRPSNRRGYVLLMTLVLLALAAAAMSNLCLRSLSKALEAKTAQADLQRRWGTLSCRSTLLPRCEAILDGAEEASREPLRALRSEFELGGQAFDLVISDEQAKVNLNDLLTRSGKREAERAAGLLLRLGGSDAKPRLVPRTSDSHDQHNVAPGPELGSFGQVFPDSAAAELVGNEHTPAAAADLTCWGTGKMNWRRASSHALVQACFPDLGPGEVNQLIVIRRENPGVDLSAALDQLQLSYERRQAVQARLGQGSRCHSLWVNSRLEGQRSWYSLSVAEASASGGGTPKATIWNFEW